MEDCLGMITDLFNIDPLFSTPLDAADFKDPSNILGIGFVNIGPILGIRDRNFGSASQLIEGSFARRTLSNRPYGYEADKAY